MIEGGHIIVTGAFGSLGRAVCDDLARRGARVIGIGRGEVPEGSAIQAVGGVELSNPASVAKAMKAVSEVTDRLAGLINLAGGFAWEAASDGSLETWDRMYRDNLAATVAMCQAALPLLRAGKGAIVNVGAASAARAGAGMAAYAAAKSGVTRLTEGLAEELKDAGVRVNAVLPSIIDTPANRADMPNAEHGRWVRPEALARVIAFLLSDEAEAVTGACIPVTGRV